MFDAVQICDCAHRLLSGICMVSSFQSSVVRPKLCSDPASVTSEMR